jgi:Protein of unknown function (DUF1573)
MNNPCRILSGTLLTLFVLALLSCGGQNGRGSTGSDTGEEFKQVTHGQPVMLFDTLIHDFGTIIEGERVVCYFDYRNAGGTDLLITAVEASCGCTIPDWNREPVGPGEQEHMKIIFDASGRIGAQLKSVTVRSNASNSLLRLTIKANVKKNV